MAKYEIKKACGCIETINIGGPVKDRDRKAEWHAEQDCRACQIATQKAEAATEAAALNLAPMTGSEKQISWAMDIRHRFIANVPEKVREIAIRLAGRRPEAKFWIDNRADLEKATRNADKLWSAEEIAEAREAIATPAQPQQRRAARPARTVAAQAMQLAWNIRRAAAKKHGVKVSAIDMGLCLRQAWAAVR